MHKLAKFIIDSRKIILVLFIAAACMSVYTMRLTTVQNDLYQFLPAETETRRGLKAMDGEFITYATADLMIEHISYDNALALSQDIENIDGVRQASFDDTQDHYKSGTALISVSFAAPSSDEICTQALDAIKSLVDARFDADNVKLYTEVGTDFSSTLLGEMLIIGALSVVTVIILLLLTSRSYAEVPVLLITFAMAAAIQQGTNFLFSEISYVANSVTLILQLALAIDYAIILCNRFAEERRYFEPYDAAVEALSKAIPEIASSSLTTIGGLVAMTFMQFGLGSDLGKVLIKSILISMLTVFLLMPGLLLMFSRAIEKTKHRSFMPNINAIGRFAWKTHKLVPPVFICVAAAAFFFSSMCPFSYNYSDDYPLRLNETQKAHQQIINTFGNNNMMALVVPTGDYETQAKMLDEISELDHVTSVLGIASVEVMDGYRLGDKLTIGEFSELAGLDDTSASALFVYYAARHADYDQVQSNMREYKIPLIDLFLFLYDVAEDGTIELPQDKIDMIESLYAQLSDAKAQLQGQHYSRMLVYSDLPTQSDESYALISQIHGVADSYYGDDVYVTGNATAARDLKDSFSTDNILVSVLSAVFVVLVIMFVFRSAGLSVLLIAVIQGSIWLNFSISYFTQNSIFFVGYLIVSAIQMGANIDYAIVISTWYSDLKTRMSPREALIKALDLSFPTVLTSGSILSAAGFLIGQITTEPSIVGIGQCLSRGTLISMFLVMFVLPQILLLGDTIVEKTSFRVPVPEARRRATGTVFVNGRVRGRISGIVDANIQGVIRGDVNALIGTGAYQNQEPGEEKRNPFAPTIKSTGPVSQAPAPDSPPDQDASPAPIPSGKEETDHEQQDQ